MTSGLVAAQGVLLCNRLMDMHCFREAEERMEYMQKQSCMIELHRCLLLCDRMYVEMISQNRREVVESMRTKQQVALMKKMRSNPSVLRTAYAYAVLCVREEKQGEDFLKQFEKVSRTYPYPVDIQAEWELIEIAREAAK